MSLVRYAMIPLCKRSVVYYIAPSRGMSTQLLLNYSPRVYCYIVRQVSHLLKLLSTCRLAPPAQHRHDVNVVNIGASQCYMSTYSLHVCIDGDTCRHTRFTRVSMVIPCIGDDTVEYSLHVCIDVNVSNTASRVYRCDTCRIPLHACIGDDTVEYSLQRVRDDTCRILASRVSMMIRVEYSLHVCIDGDTVDILASRVSMMIRVEILASRVYR
ncbi:hypothetical protein J6590_033313 [Homalodisca vitripennis]|nr:hypothetical protein J6590_033313 [Homalodisca vitripennis]